MADLRLAVELQETFALSPVGPRASAPGPEAPHTTGKTHAVTLLRQLRTSVNTDGATVTRMLAQRAIVHQTLVSVSGSRGGFLKKGCFDTSESCLLASSSDSRHPGADGRRPMSSHRYEV